MPDGRGALQGLCCRTRPPPDAGTASASEPRTVPAVQSKQPLVFADYVCNQNAANAGLSTEACLPLRLVSCHSIKHALRRQNPDFADPADCILQLQSPVSLYTGPCRVGTRDVWTRAGQCA